MLLYDNSQAVFLQPFRLRAVRGGHAGHIAFGLTRDFGDVFVFELSNYALAGCLAAVSSPVGRSAIVGT